MSISVTDPTHDAPDGAVLFIDGVAHQRLGDSWEPAPDLNEMALRAEHPYTAGVLDESERWALTVEDCLTFLQKLPDACVDAVVTDPPAAIAFMGKEWDAFEDRGAFVAFLTERLAQCFRVLRPGGHVFAWALPKTAHWTGWAMEDAGFEMRDPIYHVFGNGFAKNRNVGKDIDRVLGKKRPVLGLRPDAAKLNKSVQTAPSGWVTMRRDPTLTGPGSEEAAAWEDWGTALKPAHEYWWLGRKPFTATVAKNVLVHGTGALNIGGCRNESGRHPANFLLSHDEECADECAPGCPVAELDRQSGPSKSRKGKPRKSKKPGAGWGMTKTGAEYDDEGGASRFFYVAKPSRKEREAGLDHLESREKNSIYGDGFNSATKVRTEKQAAEGVDRGKVKNDHPTVKSIALMRYLCRLVTPPSGIVLDPFAGSGTTGCGAVLEGFRFIGVEQDPDSADIAIGRIEHWERKELGT